MSTHEMKQLHAGPEPGHAEDTELPREYAIQAGGRSPRVTMLEQARILDEARDLLLDVSPLSQWLKPLEAGLEPGDFHLFAIGEVDLDVESGQMDSDPFPIIADAARAIDLTRFVEAVSDSIQPGAVGIDPVQFRSVLLALRRQVTP